MRREEPSHASPPPLLCGYYNYLMIATDKLTQGDA